MQTEWTITIGEDHPSLAGHFPGHPIVPAVVLLGEVMHVVRQALQRNLEFVGMPSAKFVSPLNPGEALTVSLTQPAEGAIEFTCKAGVRLISIGTLQYSIAADQPHG